MYMEHFAWQHVRSVEINAGRLAAPNRNGSHRADQWNGSKKPYMQNLDTAAYHHRRLNVWPVAVRAWHHSNIQCEGYKPCSKIRCTMTRTANKDLLLISQKRSLGLFCNGNSKCSWAVLVILHLVSEQCLWLWHSHSVSCLTYSCSQMLCNVKL